MKNKTGAQIFKETMDKRQPLKTVVSVNIHCSDQSGSVRPKHPAWGKCACNPRLVLCEYELNGRMIKRWVNKWHEVKAKRSCGHLDWMFAKNAGKEPCIDCQAENA